MTTGIRNFPRGVLSTLDRLIKDMKGRRGRPDGFVGTDSHGLAETEQLGTGTADATSYLRGDNTWAVPAGTGTAGDVVGDDVSVSVQNIAAYNNVNGKHITELTGTQGQVLYHNGTVWSKLNAGTAGQFLQTGGAGADPAWASEASGAGDVTAGDLTVTSGNIVAYNGGGGTSIVEFSGVQGDIAYHNGTSWVKLNAGTYGHPLKTNGAGANPSWATVDETIYISAADCTATNINAALASLTNGGGIVQLPAGDYEMDAAIVIGESGVTLRGAGRDATWLFYDNDFNTDIVTISDHQSGVEDMTISGQPRADSNNGMGGVGTGRGVVIAKVAGAQDFIAHPFLRRVVVACTPSWNIYDSGTARQTKSGTNGDDDIQPNVSTGFCVSVLMEITDCTGGSANSGGALYMGGGTAAPKINGFKTNSYSYGTYQRVNTGGSVVSIEKGSVHLFGVSDATFCGNCAFQSQSKQASGVDVRHYDNDATMVSLLNCVSTVFHQPYFEVLSTALDGTHPDGVATYGTTTAGRQNWLITSINCRDITVIEPYVSSAATPLATTTGFPMRFWKTPEDSEVGNSITIRGGRLFHRRDVLAAASGAREAGDPSTWDRDDLVFAGGLDGTREWPIEVDGLLISNLVSGKVRPPSTPASGSAGGSIMNRENATFSDRSHKFLQLGKWEGVGINASEPDDMRARYILSHEIRGGVFAYTNGLSSFSVATQKNSNTTLTSAALFGSVAVGNLVTGSAIPSNTYVTAKASDSSLTISQAATDSVLEGITFWYNGGPQSEGLWGSSASDNDFRQIPWIRKGVSEWGGKMAGDMWMFFSDPIESEYQKALFRWYDGTNWRSAVGLVGTSSITARTTDLGATTLLTGHLYSAGMYRVNLYLTCGTAGDLGDTVTVTLSWNDGVARTDATTILNAAVTTTPKGATLTLYSAASANITYTATVSSPGAGTPSYAIEARLEAIG